MKNLLKFIPISVVLMFVSAYLITKGNEYKQKDADSVGADDAFGNLLHAVAPVVVELDNPNLSKMRKALIALRDAINNYLNASTS